MKSGKTSPVKTVRRSVAVPYQLIEEIRSLSPPELQDNFNRLVIVALRDFSTRKKKEAFQKAMAAMAADPDIYCECADISTEFSHAESDGLHHD